MRLKNKTALITGGGSGIGRATAMIFAREGASVVVSDINEIHANETARSINNNGGKAITVVSDVSISQDADEMVRTAMQAYGRLDVLVNSAGVTSRNALPSGASPEEIWDRVIEINLKGTYLVTWHAVSAMEQSGGGSVINLSSIIGLVGYSINTNRSGGGFNPYASSKGAVLQFTRNLAIEYARKNIRVNCICPGYVATNLTKSLTDDNKTREELEKLHPMGRLARAEEIAYAALFLASDESSFVTGSPLIVDGGYTAQ